jgi:hypothetical protein
MPLLVAAPGVPCSECGSKWLPTRPCHPLPSSTHHPLLNEKKDEVLMQDEAIEQKYEVFKI